jgi:hypothetical protein
MRGAVAALVFLGASLGTAHARPTPPRGAAHPPPAPPHVAVHLAPPLPMVPGVARVRVEAARDHVVVTEELTLPRGDWQSGGLDLYVAFGAPGTPSAVDAHLLELPAGATEPKPDDPGDPVAVEPAVRHSVSTQLLLGRPSMAGVVLHVKDAQLRRVYAGGDVATLRIRSLLPPPAAGAGGARDIVVRLGIAAGQTMTLAKVQLVSLEPKAWITRAEASLCGPDADPWPLSVALTPRPPDAPSAPTIAPSMAVRHGSDDLCVRWWTGP